MDPPPLSKVETVHEIKYSITYFTSKSIWGFILRNYLFHKEVHALYFQHLFNYLVDGRIQHTRTLSNKDHT